MRKNIKKCLAKVMAAAVVISGLSVGTGANAMVKGIDTNSFKRAYVADGTVDKFNLALTYSNNGANADYNEIETPADGNFIEITGNGEYVLSYTAKADCADGDFDRLYLTSNLTTDQEDIKSGKNPMFTPSTMSVVSPSGNCATYKIDGGDFMHADQKIANPYRYNIINRYNYATEADGCTWVDNTPIEAVYGYDIKAGDTVNIHVTVSGMATDKINTNTGDASYLQNIYASYEYAADDSHGDDGVVNALIIGDGKYKMDYTAKKDSDDIYAAVLKTNLYGDDAKILADKEFSIVPTAIGVATGTALPTVYDIDATKYSWAHQDDNAENPWTLQVKNGSVNALADKVAVKKGDKVSLYFTVTGTGLTNTKENHAIGAVETPAPTPTAKPAEPTAAPIVNDGFTYNGYVAFQTKQYSFRDACDADTYGLSSTKIKYNSQIGVNGGKSFSDVTMGNAAMKENVTYTAKITGMNLAALEASVGTKYGFNMLYLSTDIPMTMTGVSVKDATLKFDGKVIGSYTAVPNKADATKYYKFMLVDTYDDGTKGITIDGDKLTSMPTDSIEITYTLSGVNFKESFDTKTIGTAKGKTFTSGDFKYKVTKAATMTGSKKAAGKVQVVGMSAKGKKKSSVNIPKTTSVTVSNQKADYQISSLSAKTFKSAKKLVSVSFAKATYLKSLPAKAFYNAKKLKKVTLNKYMSKIPSKAFYGCKKLSTLTLNKKLTSVKKDAFKGCTKKIKVSAKASIKKSSLKNLKKSAYKKFR